MADVDYQELNTGTGGAKILVDTLTTVNGAVATPPGVQVQRTKVGYGTKGDYRDVTTTSPLPVTVIGGSSSGLTDAQLRATPVPVEATITFPPSMAVTGTFWQATQPVSGTVGVSGSVAVTGTFWQATQPVSIASPVAVTGTFWQAIQPVSGAVSVTGSVAVTGPLTDAQLRASALPVSGTVSVSGSVPVTGTFWQATQPVSGTVGVSGSVAVTGPLTDTQLRASALPVTGTFWQATQPVSAASLPLPANAATESGLSTINTTLGTPFQAGGSISNTAFEISGTLPAYASTPTFNLGTIGTAATEVTLAAINGKLPALATDNPHATDPAITVAQRPVSIWTATFSMVGTFSAVNPKFTQRRLGTGVTATQASGNLAIVAGTTANQEFLARSVNNFTGAYIHRARVTLSQRIANNNFAVMLADRIGEGLTYNCTSATVVDVTLTAHGFTAVNVGQAMCLGGLTVSSGTGVPGRYVIASIPDANTIRFTVAGWATGTGTLDLFGWNYYRALYTGTTATAVNVDAQREGWATGDTAATINTTASPGHILQLAVDGRQATWSDTLATSTTTPTVTTRASRFEGLPEPETVLYVYLWSFNGTTAPASSSTYTVGFVSMEDTVNNPVYLAGVRPTGQAAALPVSIPGTQAVSLASLPTLPAGTNSIGNIVRQSGFTDSSSVLAANATFTGTSRTPATSWNRFVARAFSDQAGTLYIDLSLDTGATWQTIESVALTAGTSQKLSADLVGAVGAATLYRVRYTNGATLQTLFRLSSAYIGG